MLAWGGKKKGPVFNQVLTQSYGGEDARIVYLEEREHACFVKRNS
jgi:hypothetical protein